MSDPWVNVRQEVAAMKKDGEIDEDGDEFILENDDAVATLHSLIDLAREAVAKVRLEAAAPDLLNAGKTVSVMLRNGAIVRPLEEVMQDCADILESAVARAAD